MRFLRSPLAGALSYSADSDSPYSLPNNAAAYSLSGAASSASYLTGASGLYYVADRSGNSAVNGLVLPKVAGNDASTIDAVANRITGNISMRIKLTWGATPTADLTMYSKWAAPATRAWAWNIDASGIMRFYVSTDGTVSVAGVATVAVSVAIGATVYLGVSRTQSDGVCTFFTSTDGVTWSQLGATSVSLAGLPIFNSTQDCRIGGITGTPGIVAFVFYQELFSDATFTTRVQYFNPSVVAKVATSVPASTGETWTVNQTAIALPARIHGARDLYQHLTASMPTYLAYSGTKFGYLNGVAGNYFSTPDSVAVSITGDIDIRVNAAADDWTPAAAADLISKWGGGGAGTSVSFKLALNTNGTLRLQWSADGSASAGIKDSTVAVPFADMASGWVRATLDVDNGAAGNDVKFYTSTDGVTWTQLGTTVTTAGVTSIFDSAAVVMVGARDTGSAGNFFGKTLRAQIYNGIAGTLVADFNPALFTSGTTFTASTGEVWTRNAGAYIGNGGEAYFDGTADYLKSAPYSLSNPESVYFVGSQVTWTSDDRIFDGNSNNSRAVWQNTGTPDFLTYAGTTDAAIRNGGWAIGAKAVLALIFSGAASSARVNLNTATTGSIGAVAGGAFTLGSRSDGVQNSNITWSQTLIRSVADDTALSTRIIRYFMRIGGIS